MEQAALSDALTAPVCLAVNGLLAWASWRLSHRLFPADQWFQHIGHVCLIGYAVVVLVGTLLGSIGLLVPWAYLSVVGFIALITGFALARSREGDVGYRTDAVHPEAWSSWQAGAWTGVVFSVVWGCVASFYVCHTVIYGVMRFPSEWDTLMYHLPFVDIWLQRGTLYAPVCHLWSNPANNELFTLWIVGPFSGDFFYSLSNLPAVVLMACGALEVGRCVGLSFCLRQLAALAVVTHIIVQAQLQGSGNDVAAAGLFLSCLAYVMRYARRSRRSDLLLGVTALGLLAGTKYYALGYALIAVLVAIGLITPRLGWRGMAQAAGYGLAGMTVFGGYWYLRNLLATGTPLYPVGGRVGEDSMSDVYPAVWESTLAGNQSPELFDLTKKVVWDLAGPCHWVTLLCLPAAASWVIALAALGRGPRTLRRARAALAVAAVAAVGVWAVCPFAVESDPGTLNQLRWKFTPGRFGLCAHSLCILVFCIASEDLARRLGRLARRVIAPALPPQGRRRLTQAPAGLVRLAFAAALVYQWDNQNLHNSSDFLASPLWGLWDTVLLGVNLFLVTYIFVLVMAEIARRYKPLFQYLLLILLIGALGAGAAFTAHRSARWHHDYASFYDSILGKGLFRELAASSSPGDTFCVMDERYYPFFGSARQFRVVQPPATGSAARWENSPARHACNLIIIRPDIKYKWVQAQNVVLNSRARPIYTSTSWDHLVYTDVAINNK